MDATTSPLSIGGKGPGGGIVFYVDSSRLCGLETRPAPEVKAMAWPYATLHVAALARRLGPGWRLPSIEELQLLYQQKEAVGGFDHDFHWSSTEINSEAALSLVDNTGVVYPLRKRGDACYVRAIRNFGPNDPTCSEIREIRVEPHERVTWSEHWRYNFDEKFTQQEKDEILLGVKTSALIPDLKQAAGYTWENSKFSVYIYWNNGVWEINGGSRTAPATSTTNAKPSQTPSPLRSPSNTGCNQKAPVPIKQAATGKKWWPIWR